MSERKYIPVSETAKLVRKALGEAFPGVKFSVRSKSYAGGASIRIGWTDGPLESQVGSVARMFEGGYFDGSIDYQGSRYHSLDGEPVQWGADFVFLNRCYSDDELAAAIERAGEAFGRDNIPTAEEHKNGEDLSRYPFETDKGCIYWSWHNIIRRAVEGKDRETAPEVTSAAYSQTLARVEYTGSDGYGQCGGV